MTRAEYIEFQRLARKARRVCLRCDQEFDSHSPGNRICSTCSQRSEFAQNVQPRGRVRRGHGKDEGDSP